MQVPGSPGTLVSGAEQGDNGFMKTLLLSVLFLSCSGLNLKDDQEKEIRDEVAKMDSALNDFTFEVHRPLYNIRDDE